MPPLSEIELPSTPSITFKGRIYPYFIKISFISRLTAELPPPPGSPYAGLDVKLQVAIKHSEVEVRCYLNRIVQSDKEYVFSLAYEFARSVVDLIAFSKGTGLTLVLDKAIYADGSTWDVERHQSQLPELCTAFNLDSNGDFLDVLVDLLKNRGALFALRDLIETLEDQWREGINCARAIEALSHVLAPGEKGSNKRWSKLQRTLNVTEAYLKPITEYSKGPRHGNYFDVTAISHQEVQVRAWTVMNRFLEYRKRGSAPLPVAESLYCESTCPNANHRFPYTNCVFR